MIDAMNAETFAAWPDGGRGGDAAPRDERPGAKAAQPNASAATTPIKITKLYDNLYLLQGEGVTWPCRQARRATF